MNYSNKRLYKSDREKMVAGVLGGIAEYFGIDPTMVRLGYVLLSLFSAAFPGLIAYIVKCIVIPSRPAPSRQPPRFG